MRISDWSSDVCSSDLDPEVLMESLFRQTDLEVRIGLNMNVLDADNTPRVMNLREVLRAFLDHRHEVLKRQTLHRLEKIAHRLEELDGYLNTYPNHDAVIRIIRERDDTTERRMLSWKTDRNTGTEGKKESLSKE